MKLAKEIPGDPNSDKVVKQRRKLEEVNELSDWRNNINIVDGKLNKVGFDQIQAQENLINKFRFVKVFVSPHRSAIETALNILYSHPQHNEGGFTFILYPMLNGQLTNCNDLTLQRSELDKWLRILEYQYGSIKFDTSHLDKVVQTCPYPQHNQSDMPILSDKQLAGKLDLWSLHIQSDLQLKKELFASLKSKYAQTGTQKIEHMYDVIMDKYKNSGIGGAIGTVEDDRGVYNRVQRGKQMLKEYY